MITRLFSRMFDAVQAEEDELLKQVQSDLNTAAKEGKVDTEQLSYESSPKEGVINVVDKGNNEVTQFVPEDDGFLMKSDDQSYLIPKLTEAIEKLNEKIDNIEKPEVKEPGNGTEAPSSAERTDDSEGKPKPKEEKPAEPSKKEKSESAAHPDQKVVIPIDGEFRIGYIIEEQDSGKVKVKVPSLDLFVTILKSSIPSVQSISASEQEEKPKRTVDEYQTFSRKFVAKGKQRSFSAKSDKRNFVAKGKQRNFSTGTYAIFVDLGNSNMEPYAKADNPFNIKEKDKCLKDGFKSLDEANAYINDNQKELRQQIRQLNRRNFVAK